VDCQQARQSSSQNRVDVSISKFEQPGTTVVLPDNGAALSSFGHSDLLRHSPAVPKPSREDGSFACRGVVYEGEGFLNLN